MQIALTTLRAAIETKLGCVLTPELVSEIVFKAAQKALCPSAAICPSAAQPPATTHNEP